MTMIYRSKSKLFNKSKWQHTCSSSLSLLSSIHTLRKKTHSALFLDYQPFHLCFLICFHMEPIFSSRLLSRYSSRRAATATFQPSSVRVLNSCSLLPEFIPIFFLFVMVLGATGGRKHFSHKLADVAYLLRRRLPRDHTSSRKPAGLQQNFLFTVRQYLL